MSTPPKAYIEAIASALPTGVQTNTDIQRENPSWDMAKVMERGGVSSRAIAAENETAFDLSKKACDSLFADGRFKPADFDGIIYCTQTPDYIMPPNAHLLHKHLGLADNVLAFDFNLACSGFVYGLSIANAFIASGQAKKILLVTADTYSKYIHQKDRSLRALFGDAAAVSVISADDNISGFPAFSLATHGKAFDKFYIPAGGCRTPKNEQSCIAQTDSNGNTHSDEHIQMDGMAVWSFINSAVPIQIREYLAKTGWTLNDVDRFIFHQASKMTLDSLARILGIPTEKMPTNIVNLGNTVSASIPLCLRQAVIDKQIKKGEKILVSGFGVGLSYATTSFVYEREIHVY